MMVLDDLFRVSKLVTLPTGKEAKVSALGEASVRERERLARSAAAKYRKKLRDTTSEEYDNLVVSLADLESPQLVDFLVLCYTQLTGNEEARLQAKNTFVPEPDDSTFEEKLDTVEAQKAADEATAKHFNELVTKLGEDYKNSVEAWSPEKLLAEAQIQAVQFYSYSEYLRSYILASVLLSATLNGKKLFKDLATLDDANREVVNMLYEAFVEVNNKDVWTLSVAGLRGETTG
jgi:hypothetical protein